MNRVLASVLMSLAIGAGGMWIASNFRLRVEPVGTPPLAPAETKVAQVEPGKLPAHLLHRDAADGGIVQAQASAPAMLATSVAAAVQAQTPAVGLRILNVSFPLDSKTLNWEVASNPKVLVTGNTITLQLDSMPAQADLSVFLNGTLAPAGTYTFAGATDVVSLNLGAAGWPTGTVRIGVAKKNGATVPTVPDSTVDLQPAGPTSAGQLLASGFTDTPYLNAFTAPPDVGGTPINTNGGYLRLKGQIQGNANTVEFFTFSDSDPKAVVPVSSATLKSISNTGEWEYEIQLGRYPNGTKRGLVCRTSLGNSHFYYAKVIPLNWVVQNTPTKPTLNADTPASPLSPKKKDDAASTTEIPAFRSNSKAITVKVAQPGDGQVLLLFVGDQNTPAQAKKNPSAAFDFDPITLPGSGTYAISVAGVNGNGSIGPRTQILLKVKTEGPKAVSISAPGFGTGAGGKETISIQFSGEDIDKDFISTAQGFYSLVHDQIPTPAKTLTGVTLDPGNILRLKTSDIVPGTYTLTLAKKAGSAGSETGLRDIYGNFLVGPMGTTTEDVVFNLTATAATDQLPSIASGVTLQTGPNVTFPEYTRFRRSPDGFNPSDRVETRVVRLYYYRDANRVAQIVNRDVKSYNAASADVRRRAADRVRDDANAAQDERQRLERAAVQAAQESRAAEAELKQQQDKLATAKNESATAQLLLGQQQQQLAVAQKQGNSAQVTAIQGEIAKTNSVISTAGAREQSATDAIGLAQGAVQAKRSEEVKANEAALAKDRDELRLRQEQFRRDVAAATTDPDTYAPGVPDSDDPVRQCSISVIGEGLIQIRGPIKGLNVIRTMINLIDAPVGQLRVGVHTVQVNGERVERMNCVVTNIQRYLDHSRFLTTQSAQMLRKAVTTVASRKADEVAMTSAPGCTQADRDAKYLAVFFGKDFIDELRQLDSEFLRTGNKLLSLHSMDSTSLSSAMLLLALAKNNIRAEILQEFQFQTQTKLPEAELCFYLQGLSCPSKCDACKDKQFCTLAQNAKFQSFLGFFNTEVQGDDTLTPIQREFVRVAQIFKTRLVTELQLKQRVLERSLVEDRVGDYIKELKAAKDKEDKAKALLDAVQKPMQDAISQAALAFAGLASLLDTLENELAEINNVVCAFDKGKQTPTSIRGKMVGNDISKYSEADYKLIGDSAVKASSFIKQFVFISDSGKAEVATILADLDLVLANVLNNKPPDEVVIARLQKNLPDVVNLIKRESGDARWAIRSIQTELNKPQPDLVKAITDYYTFRDGIVPKLNGGADAGSVVAQAKALLTGSVNTAFATLQTASVAYQSALRTAQAARRPLDEKKMLDLLVDELEDKHIELLEGTRAHTANVDNYLKSLATALDDDFNTQFYQPAFRKIRTLGAGWDVSLGQIESTTVLTNNRSFAKVSPAASMEFDLPKRDIFIKEAFKGAKAAVDDYGALLNDPTFLSMVKMYGGGPGTAALVGSANGLSSVRNVLPGLPSSADEMIMAQAGPNRREFGTALDSLVPDPAVYKFETGTGYEIRPVISPDGQAVVFNFDYMYTTDLREPVRADEKHLGRVKRHFVHTDVQLSNYEMREVSKYWVSLKAARTSQGVQLLQDIPGVGVLFRPLPSAQSSLQENLIYAQTAIFPTLFDLMGLRYAPAVADIDPEFTKNDEFVVRGRAAYLQQHIFDFGASKVDDALRILYGERRPDLYRSQFTIPWVHPNGYSGPGQRQKDSHMIEGYNPKDVFPQSGFHKGMHAPMPNFEPLGGTLPGSGFSGPGCLTPGQIPNTPITPAPVQTPSQTANQWPTSLPPVGSVIPPQMQANSPITVRPAPKTVPVPSVPPVQPILPSPRPLNEPNPAMITQPNLPVPVYPTGSPLISR